MSDEVLLTSRAGGRREVDRLIPRETPRDTPREGTWREDARLTPRVGTCRESLRLIPRLTPRVGAILSLLASIFDEGFRPILARSLSESIPFILLKEFCCSLQEVITTGAFLSKSFDSAAAGELFGTYVEGLYSGSSSSLIF